MSMFRRPGDSSDESSETSSEEPEENTNDDSIDNNLLSRINTLSSNGSVSAQLPHHATISRNNSHVRDLLLHSLLEEKTLREAAQHLNKDQNDPEVQKLAHETYQTLSRQLSGDEQYASEEMRAHRATANQGLSTITRSHLATLAEAGEGNAQGALVSRFRPLRTLSAISPLLSNLPVTAPPGLVNFPGLHTDRYAREFVELGIVGKGGYGKVFRVKHKLDNSMYAVKRIMVSPARLQKIEENGPQEMERMLEEVRALARFDHGNIVRYHNCWLEFTSAPADIPVPPPNVVRTDRLLEHAPISDIGTPGIEVEFGSLSVGDPFGPDISDNVPDIVFESSDADDNAVVEEFEDDDSLLADRSRMPRKKKRRGSHASQATIATVSSTHSHMSTIESVEGSEEDDVETIERSHQPQYHDTSEVSESMISHSDAPEQLISARTQGPLLTLNVQMSLYETNLADFLSTQPTYPAPTSTALPSVPPDPHPKHCFHVVPSLDLLSAILSGVQYLHTQSVVHRDLKPANIFLSLSRSPLPPSGSTNLSACPACHKNYNNHHPSPSRHPPPLHMTPRIGDFGLVAALDDSDAPPPPGSIAPLKPVGTEFYRPPSDARISEKLDVFALGVVGFEMLQPFATRMERVDALTRLRRGEFPQGFRERVGEGVVRLLEGMVCAEVQGRLGCEGVRRELEGCLRDVLGGGRV